MADIHQEGQKVEKQVNVGEDLFNARRDIHVTQMLRPSPSLPQTPRQIPPPPANFTGREKELADLERQIGQGAVGLFGLRGIGGIGKTALACAAAPRLENLFPDGQIYLDLMGVPQSGRKPLASSEVLGHIIRSFQPEAKLPEGENLLRPLYFNALHGKRVLLLMDNAGGPDQIEPLLPLSPGCAIIVTSRERFHLDGIHPVEMDVLAAEDARELLLKIVPRIGSATPALAKLCGYNPMALKLAASALAERPDIRVDNFLADFAVSNKRFGLIGGILTSSLELVDEIFRRLWNSLGVFPKYFDHEAAAAVWEIQTSTARDVLGELLNHSLIEWDGTKERYYLHDLARDYAAAKMPAAERAEAEGRHSAHYYRVLIATHSLYLKGGEKMIGGLRLFDREWENIQAGRDWAAARAGGDKTAARLCVDYSNAGVFCLTLRLHPRERMVWLESWLSAARKLGDRVHEGYALGNLGLAYFDLGNPRRAIEFYEQQLTIAREIGARHGEGVALGNLGIAYKNLGEPRRAIEFHEQALVIAREIGDRQGEANALGNLGNAYAHLGEPRRAIESYEQQLVIAREIGDRQGEGNALGNLGLAYAGLGDPRRAIEFYEQHLAIAREIGDRQGEANALGNLGLAYAALGEPRRAIEFYEQQLVIVREIGDRRGEGITLFNKALALDSLNRRAEAIPLAQAALAIFGQIEDPNAAKVRKQLQEWDALEKD